MFLDTLGCRVAEARRRLLFCNEVGKVDNKPLVFHTLYCRLGIHTYVGMCL